MTEGDLIYPQDENPSLVWNPDTIVPDISHLEIVFPLGTFVRHPVHGFKGKWDPVLMRQSLDRPPPVVTRRWKFHRFHPATGTYNLMP